jgi:Na+/melibiose symporter-like transporter
MIARIWDAVIDPVLGLFSDKLRVRYGTRRHSMLISALLIVVSMFLMFYPFSNPSLAVRFWAALLSYIFFYTVQSSFMIPYYSLSSEITEDYTERARMTTVRMGCSIFASILCVAVPGMIVDAFEGNTGYIAMSLIFGTLFMICASITGFFAKEGIPPPKAVKPFEFANLIRPFRVKAFRQYLWILLCCQVTMAIMSAMFFFYVDFYYCRDLTASGEGNMVGLLGAAIMFGMQIVALPVYMALIKKTSKAKVYIVGSAIWIVSALVLLVLPAGADAIWLYLLAAVMGFGISGPGLIPHAIYGDVVDVGYLQLSERAAGEFAGVANFVYTIAQAVGLALVMGVIGAAGFIEQDISEGAAKVVAQPESAQTAIILVMALAPLVFMSFGIFVCTRYRLNKENHARVLAALEGSEEEKLAVLQLL